jgi:glutathione S-transferase
MSLTLHYHPLSSFCWKALIALYENDTPFTPQLVNFGDPAQAAAFKQLWPVGKFPVLRDERSNLTVPESTVIIEYLDRHYPGRTRFLSDDPDSAHQIRLTDRIYDLHLHMHMQKVVGDRLRPEAKRDPHGVEDAKTRMRTTLDMVDRDMQGKTWAVGENFTMADCAAAPALYYANLVVPFAESHRNAAAYLDRLLQRPSFARTVKEAEPYRHMFPT